MHRSLILARDPLIAEEAALTKLPKGVSVQRWHGSDLSVERVFEHLGSVDLFGSTQAYLYLNVLELKLRKADGERLSGILARLPEETFLACTQVFEDVSYRDEERLVKGADLQRWASGAKVEDLRRAGEGASAQRWLQERAKGKHGLLLTPPQAQRLLTVSGERLALADGELRKLALLKAGDEAQPITDAVLEETLALSPAARFWELVDGILAGAPGSIASLTEWHGLEPEGFRLLAELRRRLLGLRSLQRGEPVQPPFFARQLQGVARRWPAPRLNLAIELLVETEFRLKSGLIPGESSKDAELAALQVLTRQLVA